MNHYDFKTIEAYWQKKWEAEGVYKTDTGSSKKKFYGLVEFPYPSGIGLHVGHVRSYTGMDIIARKRRTEGYEVMFPIGWDAFGLPAENYAIKTGIHPSITTHENIDTFRRQLKACGFSFDWNREIDTTDPLYYRWTQWIFLKMYEKGLAYKKEMPVNWCPKDKCVLANEEVVDGKCERCGAVAEKRNKEQWMLAITKYAERLHKDLDDTQYLEKIKIQQRNWIGISEGSEIDFTVKAKDFLSAFTVFTTRPDTLFGCTYCVLAPDHTLVTEMLDAGLITNAKEVQAYVKEAVSKLDLDRSAEGKEKTGIQLEGVLAINPVNQEEVPVYVADYVLASYGTGAIMAVPGHDARDSEFAAKYGIATKHVVNPYFENRTDDSAIHEGMEFVKRGAICAIVHNPKNDTYLCISWKNVKMNGLVTGGIDEGEHMIHAALREIQEETGYTARFVRESPIVLHSLFYHRVKQVNRWAKFQYMFFELDDDTQGEISEDEKKLHDVVWKTRKEMNDFFTVIEGTFALNLIDDEHYMFTDDGILVNSGAFSGLLSLEARKKITEAVGGRFVTKTKLRDWVFARQRYWGEPIPLVYDEDGKLHPVHESNLPIILPQVDKFEPTDNGESPLYQVPEWVNVRGSLDEHGYFKAGDGEGTKMFRRETDTMPQWAGSSWYFMRYIDPRNNQSLGDTDMIKKWLSVDWYNGGMEHTTLHLLYSRFWYKFLYDIGVVPSPEPYMKRTSQGMILGAGGIKMSKSLGNVVNPDDIINEYGADTLRVYEMFIGPFDQAVAWDSKAIVGVKRFLDRVYALKSKVTTDAPSLPVTHQTVKKVTEQIEQMAFNTCISQMMICSNEYDKAEKIQKGDYEMFLEILAPFAPHIAEELWRDVGNTVSIHGTVWPSFDPAQLIENEVTISLQIAGKLRGTFVMPIGSSDEEVLKAAKALEGYTKYVGDTEPKKVIVVPNRIINIVI